MSNSSVFPRASSLENASDEKRTNDKVYLVDNRQPTVFMTRQQNYSVSQWAKDREIASE